MQTLTQQLGYDPTAKLLIVNCDDLGSSHAANTAIHRAMTSGIATSATLMVPCPWAQEAARMTAGLDVGVHLTLTGEYPGYRWRSLTGAASLHDADGFLPTNSPAAIARAKPADVRAECRAQIDQALAWGVDVTHLDSHMGVVQLAARLYDVYLELAVEYRLPLRMVGPRNGRLLGFKPRAKAAARGAVFTDDFFHSWGKDTRAFLTKRIAAMKPGVAEAYGHPVDDGSELRGYDLENADMRVADGRCFTDPAMKAMLVKAGITPISYRPLRDLQRGLKAEN
ncbi:MAG TPA: polysaccharide deacetylase family protein [Caulobacteraceae bacterium]|jgi:hypothetical protein|nr:polysaccharide deacetylase family protein [Caulobacteraceae bacterium]